VKEKSIVPATFRQQSNSVDHTHRRQAEDLASHTATSDGAVSISNKPARRDAPDGHNLLDRILNTPRLERVIPQLQPDLLHRVIQSFGLEDCGELVALATPTQLSHIFDLDLWRASQPGLDEQFDADRFGLWIEVLVESGVARAAQKLAGMDVDLVVAGLAQHMLVYDRAAITPYETMDGEEVAPIHEVDDKLTIEVGVYVLVARRADSWEAIVEVLMSLDENHRSYFYRVMSGCRALSNSKLEIDGLHDILLDAEQVMFDLAVDRERRREKQGYVTPALARAFLQMARQFRLESEDMPPANHLARAYFREIDNSTVTDPSNESGLLKAGSEALPAPEDTADAVAAVIDVLIEAGALSQPPRALLGGAEDQPASLSRMQTHMQFVLENNQMAYSTRSEELVYLANTLMAGCSIQTRPFTAQEALDAAVAVCNLGLENWPPHWLPAQVSAIPGSFLVDHDLVSVFQVGWTVLHHDVSMYAAGELIEVLKSMRCDDSEIQTGLDALRVEMVRHWQAGAPWRARNALDVIATLDMPAWVVLLALTDECPVLHAGIGASKDSRVLSVSASDFEFISENPQIASVREYMQSLPEILRR
jgi:hypothetical protein